MEKESILGEVGGHKLGAEERSTGVGVCWSAGVFRLRTHRELCHNPIPQALRPALFFFFFSLKALLGCPWDGGLLGDTFSSSRVSSWSRLCYIICSCSFDL